MVLQEVARIPISYVLCTEDLTGIGTNAVLRGMVSKSVMRCASCAVKRVLIQDYFCAGVSVTVSF